MNTTTNRQLTLAGTRLDRYLHICSFFSSRDEEYDVLAPFFKQGLDGGEKAFHIVGPGDVEDHAAALQQRGIDCAACRARGQLEIMDSDATYLRGGAFDQDAMLATVDEVFAAGREAGFSGMRIMGRMDWAFDDNVPGADRLISYEARVNDILERNRQPAICVYDVARLTGTVMMDILRCHPLTLVNGVIHENPYFMPPEDMLAELRRRQERRA